MFLFHGQMRTFITSVLVLALAAVTSAFVPAVKPLNRWVAVKAAGGLDAEVTAELKKLEDEAAKRLEEKKKELEASLKK